MNAVKYLKRQKNVKLKSVALFYLIMWVNLFHISSHEFNYCIATVSFMF